MKKALLVSCFGWYEERLKFVEERLQMRGYEVQVWISDYSHFKKERSSMDKGLNYIHVRAYKNNLSLGRLYSHYDFCRQMYHVLERELPEVVMALIPPNSVAHICGKYKCKHPNTKLIFDIIDMWPESYTAPKLFEAPFKIWASLRDKNLKYADHIFTECSFYQRFLIGVPTSKISTLHLFRGKDAFAEVPAWNGEDVQIGYLGSINSLIDIPLIEQLVREMCKSQKVKVHIVGGGKNAQNFVNALTCAGAIVDNHGVIFDKDKMRAIIGGCHFAINMMKPSVCVGLTIKSMDYFQMGVPLLNTIKGDSNEIVRSYNCGFNVEDTTQVATSMVALSAEDYCQMRKQTQKAFNELFTFESFRVNLENGINKVINE